MKKRVFPVLFILLLLCFSGCTGSAEVPAPEFGTADGGVSAVRFYFDGESPVFLENGVTDDEAGTLRLNPPYQHVFDLEVLDSTGAETVYRLPERYAVLRDAGEIEGILIYSEYAYAAVQETDGLRLHPLSPGAPTMRWDEFYAAALKHARESSELSGVENYGF
ncbi:MAG: hypothetical protein ACI4GO_05635 [Hominenteromicrobium sp.]